MPTLGLFLIAPLHAATFTVTSDADSGAGSLREALASAAASAGTDTIAFAIPGAGPHTITLDTPLDRIEETVIIDGTTQSGASCGPRGSGHTLMIHVDGQEGTADGEGVSIYGVAASGTTVRGLAITGFDHNGVRVEGAANVVIQCSYIGIDVDGATAMRNRQYGINTRSRGFGTVAGLTIGTDGDGVDDDVEWNLVSGNRRGGIRLAASSDAAQTTGVVIAGNLVGSNAAGDAPVRNEGHGVVIYSRFTGVRVGTDGDGQSDLLEGNVLSGNYSTQLSIQGDYVHDLVVAGNQIGGTLDGSAALDPDRRTSGIGLSGHHDDVRIGGTSAVEANRFLRVSNGVSIRGERKQSGGRTDFTHPNTFYSGGAPERPQIVGNVFGEASDGSAIPVQRAVRLELVVDATIAGNTVLGDGRSGAEAFELKGAEVEVHDNTITNVPYRAIELAAYTGDSSIENELTTPDDVLTLANIYDNHFVSVNQRTGSKTAAAIEAYDTPVDPINDDQGATLVSNNTFGDLNKGTAVRQSYRGAVEYVDGGSPAVPAGPLEIESDSALWNTEKSFSRVRTQSAALGDAVLMATSSRRDMSSAGHWSQYHAYFRDSDGRLDTVTIDSRCGVFSFDGDETTHATDSGVGMPDGIDAAVSHAQFAGSVTATVSRYQVFELSGACEVCGNGVTGGAETCDDGNTADGDGCSASCRIETGYVCPTVELASSGVDAGTAAMLDHDDPDPRWSVSLDGGSFETADAIDLSTCGAGGWVQNTVAPGSRWLVVPGDPCSTTRQDRNALLTYRTTVNVEPADLGAGTFERLISSDNRIEEIRINGVAVEEVGRSGYSRFRVQTIPTTDLVVGSNTVELDIINSGGGDAGLNVGPPRSVCVLDTDGDGIGDAGDPDADDDGIANDEEGTDDADGDGVPAWLDLDSDGDGTLDVTEAGLPDADSDGMVDGPDTDGDGVRDEVDADPGDPADNTVEDVQDLQDTDGDGLSDAQELVLGTDVDFADTDGDLLTDGNEVLSTGSDPTEPDTDGDGLIDGLEVLGLDTVAYTDDETDPLDADMDDDGLSDRTELFGPDGLLFSGDETLAQVADTDGDGIVDGVESGVEVGVASGETPWGVAYEGTDESVALDADPTTRTDPTLEDTDGDGLLDGEEDLDADGAITGIETDPTLADTDGGGTSDGDEILDGTDPLDPADDG